MSNSSTNRSNLENLIVPFNTVSSMSDPKKAQFNDIFIPKRNLLFIKLSQKGPLHEYEIAWLRGGRKRWD